MHMVYLSGEMPCKQCCLVRAFSGKFSIMFVLHEL